MNQFLKNEDAEELLKKEIPLKQRYILLNLVQDAYKMYNTLATNYPFFDWRVGRDYLSFLKPLIVEFKIKDAIDKGDLNMDYRIASNAIDNCRHIELLTNQCVVTISQVSHSKAQPRPAVFRKNLCLSKQIALDFGPEYRLYDEDDLYYILLTHGYQSTSPQFVCVGFPEAYNKGWIARHNLLELPQLVEIAQEEKIEEGELINLKKYVERMTPGGR